MFHNPPEDTKSHYDRRRLLAQQRPLHPNLTLATELLHELRFVAMREQVRAAIGCIVANALLAHWHGDNIWVFYSRDNTHYAVVRAGVPSWYSRSAVVTAVDQLTASGLLEERRTAPSPSARYRSTFRSTPRLIHAIGPADVSNLRWPHTPPVILRSRDDRRTLNAVAALTDAEFAEFTHIGADVERHNAFLSAFDARLDHDAAEVLPSGLVKVGDTYLNPALRCYHRVFNGDLNHGGRWYGPWWQAVPSAVRPRLLIDGEPTIELDFAACQLRLMFARLGLPDPLAGAIRIAGPALDLYTIAGVARDDVKLALLIMINARSMQVARQALAAKLICEPGTNRRREAARILSTVQRHFPQLKELWFSELGLRLQRIDSDICATIHQRMRAQTLPVLSVHDGFITWTRAEPQLRIVMQEAFERAGKDAM